MKAARCFEYGNLDFAFIDGEHSDEAVKVNYDAWWPKIWQGGLMMGHDCGLKPLL